MAKDNVIETAKGKWIVPRSFGNADAIDSLNYSVNQLNYNFETTKEQINAQFAEAAKNNSEALEALSKNMFNPDSGVIEDKVRTMMMQVGSDSMNYQLDETSTGSSIGVNGEFKNGSCTNDRFIINGKDTLRHYSFIADENNKGTWEISDGINMELTEPSTYFVAIRCERDSTKGEWICDTIQHMVDELPNYWYFNWGIINYDPEKGRTLTETRGNSYMYGDNLVCGKIKTLTGNSYFDLTKGEFVLGEGGSQALSYKNGVLTIGGVATKEEADNILKNLGFLKDELSKDIDNTKTEINNQIAEKEQNILNQAAQQIANIVEPLQNQIDGVVDSWFFEGKPTLNNKPAVDWLSDETKRQHIGDTYTDISAYDENNPNSTAGRTWRWCEGDETKGWYWHEIADSDSTRALLEASKAQAAADGKCTIFLTKPDKPYNVGDMWILQSEYTQVTGDKKTFTKGTILNSNAKSDTFDESHWTENVRYTDDTVANQAQDYAEKANENANNARINAEEAKAAAERAETGAQALNYLKTTMTDGTTDIAGGLVLTNVMALKDLDGNVTAGLSGLDEDNVLLWGGANYQDAVIAANHDYKKEDGELITSLIKKDGTGKIGVFEVDNDSAVVNDFTGDERVVISNKKLSEQDSVLDISSKTYSTVDSIDQNKASIISNKYYIFNIPRENIENKNWNDDGVLSYMNGKISINDFGLDSDSSSANIGFYIGIGKDTGDYDYISIQNIKLINNGNNKLVYDDTDPNVGSSTSVSLKFRIDLSGYNILGKDLDNRIKYAIKIDTDGSNLIFSEGQDCSILFCCSTKKIQICSDGMRILTDNGCQTTFGNQFGFNKIIIKNLPGYTLNINELNYDEYGQYQLYCSENSETVHFFNMLNTNLGNLEALLSQFKDFFSYFNEFRDKLNTFCDQNVQCLQNVQNIMSATIGIPDNSELKNALTKLENCLKAGRTYTGKDGVERYGILSKRSGELNPSVDDYRLPLDDLTGEVKGTRKALLNNLIKRSNFAVDEFDNVKTIHIK